MKKSECTIGSQTIAVYESDGNGPSVFMLHGNSASSRSFCLQMNSSLGNKYHLVAIDLPGHGASAPAASPETTYSIPGYASIVSQLIQKLNLEDSVLIGHSLGGHILLEALESLPSPKGCIIFGTPPLGNPPAFDQAFLPNPIVPLAFKNELTKQERNNWLQETFSDSASIPQNVIEDLEKTDGQAREYLGKSLSVGKIGNEVETVTSLNCPLAVIHGAREKLVSLKYLQGLEMPTLWKGSVQVISDASHFSQLESPKQMNQLIKEFLEYIELIG